MVVVWLNKIYVSKFNIMLQLLWARRMLQKNLTWAVSIYQQCWSKHSTALKLYLLSPPLQKINIFSWAHKHSDAASALLTRTWINTKKPNHNWDVGILGKGHYSSIPATWQPLPPMASCACLCTLEFFLFLMVYNSTSTNNSRNSNISSNNGNNYITWRKNDWRWRYKNPRKKKNCDLNWKNPV